MKTRKSQNASKGWGVALAVALLCLTLSPTNAAVIAVDTYDTTGVQSVSAGAGTTSGSLNSFAHTGESIVVTVMAVGENAAGFGGVSPAATVTFGATSTSTPIVTEERSGDQYSAIFLLNDVSAATLDITVGFGTDIFSTGAGAWEISAFSLSNIDTANPIASFANLGNPGAGNTQTMTSAFSGAISAGDFIVEAYAADNTFDNPNYQTSQTSVTADFTRAGPNGLTRNYALASGLLVAGDISNVDDLVLTQTDTRTGIRPTVIFNAIPEPSTAALLGVGLALLAARRRIR